MRRKLVSIFTMLSLGLAAGAADVSIQSGGLAEAIGDDVAATSLTVSGTMNATDFKFIADKMISLETLDISAIAIEGNKLPDYALMGTKITSVILPEGLVEIGEGALASTSISAIAIPSTVKTIAQGAFSGCDNLTAVELPAAVTSIESHAFLDCDNLASVTIGAGVADIPESAFARCRSLSAVALPASLKTIGKGAFLGCGKLVAIALPASIQSIGEDAFRQTGLTALDASNCEQLTEIGAWAFARCESLTSVALPDNVSAIGDGAFFDNARLAVFKTPASCTEISAFLHKGNVQINTGTLLHEEVEEIGDYALMGIDNVSVFAIPPSVMKIGSNAFEGWTSLTSLDVSKHTEVPQLGENVWQGVDQTQAVLSVSGETYYAFTGADQWSKFNVVNTTPVGIDDIEAAGNGVTAYFSGSNLVLKATSEIDAVRVYDSSGRQFMAASPRNSEMAIDTSAWNCRIYIVNIMLVSGETTTIKVTRR